MRFSSRLLALAALALMASQGTALAGAFGSDYEGSGTCGGYPKADIATPPWLCAAIVAGPDQGLKFPRDVLELAPGHVLVSDMGGFKPGLGRILDITVAPNSVPSVKTIFSKLDQPNGLRAASPVCIPGRHPSAIPPRLPRSARRAGPTVPDLFLARRCPRRRICREGLQFCFCYEVSCRLG